MSHFCNLSMELRSFVPEMRSFHLYGRLTTKYSERVVNVLWLVSFFFGNINQTCRLENEVSLGII